MRCKSTDFQADTKVICGFDNLITKFGVVIMDRSELLKEISGILFKSKVEELSAFSSENDSSISDLLHLSFYPTTEIAFRAAWILEYVQQNHPERFFPFIKDF